MCSPVLVSQAMAQTTDTAAATTDTKTDATAKKAEPTTPISGNDVVVVVHGVRASVEDANKKKRKAKQISDSVSAEDAGKLPDNNVPEALAHITGVQITRDHGEGADVAIRGMQSVSTTINGNSASGGELRSMNHNQEDGGTPDNEVGAPSGSLGPTLSDVPAALIKSVTVYKTRTADQVEGGIAGTVNIELRRPLDLQKGLTVAGSYRDSFSSIGNTSSPYASLLVADRFDTPLGEMGFLLNVGYEKNRYQEDHVFTESPNYFYSGTINGQPGYLYSPAITPTGTLTPNYITPYRVWDGVQKGTISRPTVNLGYQWKINDDLDVVVEGTYLGSHEVSEYDYLELRTQGDGNPIYSNIVTQPGTNIVKSMTETASGPYVPLYIDTQLNTVDNKTYNTNFEAHWHKGPWQINASAQYDWTNFSSYYVYEQNFLNNVSTVNVDFDSPSITGGGAAITGIQSALGDKSNYSMFDFHDGLDTSNSRELDAQIDATYTQSDTGFFRSWQFGTRFTFRRTSRYDGYRDAFPGNYNGADLAGFPTSDNLVSTTLNFAGLNESFYHLNGESVISNLAAIRKYIVANACPATGTLPATCIQNTRYDWTTAQPDDSDKTNSYADVEKTMAYYAQLNYGFNYLFPVDGTIGARAVATWGHSYSTSVTYTPGTAPAGVDPATYCAYCAIPTTVAGGGHYLDVLPNVNGTIHFTPKLQLRLAYTFNVERPTFYNLAPWLVESPGDEYIYEGNPNLKPNKVTNYDASLEYYFGRGGVVSLAAYLKKPDASFFYSVLPVANYKFSDGKVGTAEVGQTRNAGPGTYQGYEFNASGFFDFLPGFWHNFGGSVNYTYYQIFKIDYPADAVGANYDGPGNASYTSKDTYNIQLYYDTPVLSARLAYNYRSSYRSDPYLAQPQLTSITRPTSRLDASLDWTPIKQWTFSVEGTNLLKNSETSYYGTPLLPAEVRLQAQTIQIGARFRY